MDSEWTDEGRVPVVLMVDDEETVRSFVRKVLVMAGYEVLTAGNSVEALQIGSAFSGSIDVLLTDVVMRVFQNGPDMAECFSVLRPETAILLTSGSGLPNGSAAREKGWGFLPKPFTPFELLDAIEGLIVRKPENAEWAHDI